MAINNMVDKLGEAPVASIARYDFTAPANTGWLNCDGAAVSKTTYAPLYALQGNAYEGTGNLTQVAGLAGTSGNGNYMTRWHPSSNYIALGSEIATKQISISSFNGSTLTEVETIDLGTGNLSNGLDWHPGGNFLAANSPSAKKFLIYSWNGTDTLTEVESITRSYNTNKLQWHPNGNFLATTCSSGGSDELTIYSWNGSDTLASVETVDLSANGRSVAWSPNGNYLAVGNQVANNQLLIYSWNGTDTLTYICTYDYGAVGNTESSIQWSRDGNFIAMVGFNNSKQLVVLSFNGSTLTERNTIDYGTSLSGEPRWSRGGNYLAVVINQTASTVNTVFLYSWVSSTYTLTQVDVLQLVVGGSGSVDFNYTNNYIAYNGYASTTSPYNKLYAGTTGLTSCDYRTNFLLQTTATSIIRGA